MTAAGCGLRAAGFLCLTLIATTSAAGDSAGDYRRALFANSHDDRWDAILNLARQEGEVRW